MPKPIKIIFRGEEYLFIGRGASLEDGGTIVTKVEADEDAAVYAQLQPNGFVIRSAEIIGTIRDILFIDDESEGIN